MNRKREAYDRLAVGDRIRKKRVQLGFSQDDRNGQQTAHVPD